MNILFRKIPKKILLFFHSSIPNNPKATNTFYIQTNFFLFGIFGKKICCFFTFFEWFCWFFFYSKLFYYSKLLTTYIWGKLKHFFFCFISQQKTEVYKRIECCNTSKISSRSCRSNSRVFDKKKSKKYNKENLVVGW